MCFVHFKYKPDIQVPSQPFCLNAPVKKSSNVNGSNRLALLCTYLAEHTVTNIKTNKDEHKLLKLPVAPAGCMFRTDSAHEWIDSNQW